MRVGQTSVGKAFTKVAMWGPRVAYRPRADGSFVLGNGYRGLGADVMPDWRICRLTGEALNALAQPAV